jgi:hypothetical protein
MNTIRFCLEVCIQESGDGFEKGTHTLERVMSGLSFLPPKGTIVMPLKGLENTHLNLEVSGQINLFSENEGFEWDITLIDTTSINENRVPTLKAEQVQIALDAGWTLE